MTDVETRRVRREIRGPRGALPVREDDQATQDLAMILEGETSGRPLDEVLAEFGRSRSTYYDKLRRFQELGVAGLFPGRPGPRRPWRRTAEVIRLIVVARVRNPTASAAAIAHELATRGFQVSVRSVERTLSQFELTRPA